VKIVVNGEPRKVSDGITVARLVREVDRDRDDGRGIAVAVDAEVVPRSEWEGLELSEGQRVELLGAIQGG
jgi:sulfur carrier protein